MESKIKEKLNKDTITSFLELDRFALRGYENMPTTTLRYFFARVDKFLCEKTGEKIEKDVIDAFMGLILILKDLMMNFSKSTKLSLSQYMILMLMH